MPATSQQDHLADRFSLVQLVEALVDLVELQRAAHQPVDWQPAAPVERDVARYVATRHRGSDVAALERAFLGDEADRCEWHGGRRWREAGGNGRAATAGDAISRIEGSGGPGQFE